MAVMARKNSKKSAKSTPKRRPSFIRKTLKWLLVIALWVGIFLSGLFAWYAQELPDITQKANFERKNSITVKAADGTVIARYGEIRGDSVTVEDMPQHLVYAVLAIEDRRFYSHMGVDPIGLTRAIFTNLIHGRFVQGGSTITQQLAKNLFLSQERTLKRKIQEAMLAVWLEFELTKDEILSAYLNRVYMGSGIFGVDAAAKLYFNKDVKDINLQEAATLAGLLKAPSRYSPKNNPGLSKERADIVLNAMVDADYIEKEDAENFTKVPPLPAVKPTGGDAEKYFADWVVDGLEDLIGTPQEDIIIETTMDTKIQQAAQEALIDAIMKNGEEKHIGQGAVVAMRPDGRVLAIVGGRDYAFSQFNRATQAKRQPGSSFKPYVYLAALEYGIRPDDLFMDQKITEGKYRPQNFGGEYWGEVPMRAALTLSLNTVAFQIAKIVGPDHIVDTARRLGIISPLQPDLSLALGTNEVSLLEHATAYAAIANGGGRVFPYAITKITGEDGTLYYQKREERGRRRVADARLIADLTYMMQDVLVNGTGQRARLPYPASGKTGTSQDSRDAWFMGFTSEIVAGVWMGNDDFTPMNNVTGGSFPADVWRQTMTAARGRYAPVKTSASFSDSFDSLLDRFTGPGASGDEYRYEREAREEETIQWNDGTTSRIPNSGDYND
jgi:penicillin-binding protein 1A